MAYEHKVIPFLGRMRGSSSAVEVSSQLENMINAEAADGWEFCQLGDVNIEVSPGCIASLLGSRVSYVRFDQVIFRRLAGDTPERQPRATTSQSAGAKQQAGSPRVALDFSKGLSAAAMSVLQKAKDRGYQVHLSEDKQSVILTDGSWRTSFSSEAEIINFGNNMR